MAVFCGNPLGTGIVLLLPSELGEFCVGKCQTQPEVMLLYGPRSSRSQHKAEELSCAVWTNTGCKLMLCEPKRRIKNIPYSGEMLSYSILCHMSKLLLLSQPWRSVPREGLNHSGKQGSFTCGCPSSKHCRWKTYFVGRFHCQPSLCQECDFSKENESTKVGGMCSGQFKPLTKFFRAGCSCQISEMIPCIWTLPIRLQESCGAVLVGWLAHCFLRN